MSKFTYKHAAQLDIYVYIYIYIYIHKYMCVCVCVMENVQYITHDCVCYILKLIMINYCLACWRNMIIYIYIYIFILTCNSLQETNLFFFTLRNFRCNCAEKKKKIETEINFQIRIGCVNKEIHGRKLVFVLQSGFGTERQ